MSLLVWRWCLRLSAERLLSLWDWAWSVGLLGADADSSLEELYLRFLRDDNGAARWRAIRAMSPPSRGGA